MKKYYVIGGQYNFHCYGGRDSIQAAKVLATKNEEYWDNWQGWRRPAIYAAEQVKVLDNGNVVPSSDYAGPAYIWDGKKWIAPNRD